MLASESKSPKPCLCHPFEVAIENLHPSYSCDALKPVYAQWAPTESWMPKFILIGYGFLLSNYQFMRTTGENSGTVFDSAEHVEYHESILIAVICIYSQC